MQTVGEILRAERLKKNLTIKDVESAISIRALYLNAIEEGNYNIIPGEVYVKGFIRNYATFLGLEPQRIMEIYYQNKGQVTENVPENSQQEEQAPQSSPSGNVLLKWLGVAVVVAAVVGGVAWWMSSTSSQKMEPTPPPQSAAPKQPEQATQQQTSNPTPAAQSVVPANPATAKVIINVKYNSPCWTQIVADGKPIYEGTPKIGESITWEAANNITAKFGNAGAVDLVYNGNSVGKIGGNGEVVVKTFTLTGITQ